MCINKINSINYSYENALILSVYAVSYTHLNKLKEKKETSQSEEVKAPEKEIVTAQIAGVDIMDLEDATKELWNCLLYTSSKLKVLVLKSNKMKF